MLSNKTTDQIRNVVEAIVIDYSGFVHDNRTLPGNKWFETEKAKNLLSILEAWAVWKEKAEWYRSTLDKIANGYVGYSSASQMAKEALESFNQNKVNHDPHPKG